MKQPCGLLEKNIVFGRIIVASASRNMFWWETIRMPRIAIGLLMTGVNKMCM
jgi:hypothetical protein